MMSYLHDYLVCPQLLIQIEEKNDASKVVVQGLKHPVKK